MGRQAMRFSGAQDSWMGIVEQCFRCEAGAAAPVPAETMDLIQEGILDSMGWVSFLRAVETASGVSDLGFALNERPASLGAVLEALSESRNKESPSSEGLGTTSVPLQPGVGALIASSSSAPGSRLIPSEEVDGAFGMPSGKLRERAGIESLTYAANGEDELTLGARAAGEALRAASCGANQLDWVLATSETHHRYPSLAAQLHSRLLARENCGALDVGGGCLGLLNALAVARSLIGGGQARNIAVVTADVHSRVLTPGRVAGEFGGLFGDGASAFLVRGANGANSSPEYRLGEFLFGCAGQYAAAIQVAANKERGLDVAFDGEALSRAAIARLEKLIGALELRSGIARASVGAFATHQPNPRLLVLLARQCGVSQDAFPAISRRTGNLGSSMCGAALHAALQEEAKLASGQRKPIFVASLGPGLLFGGTWLTPV